MLRTLLGTVGVFFLMASLVTAADDQNKQNQNTKNKNYQKATITKVDKTNHTITVKMKDKTGKEQERVFKLTEDIRMLDEKGNVAAIDVFKSGNEVLVIEAEGKLKELKKPNANEKNLNPNKSGVNPIK